MKKIIPIVLIISFAFVFYLSFSQATKSAKVKRVECQAETTTFERIFVEEPIKEGIEAFLSNNYLLKSRIDYSTIMPSNLKDNLYVEELDKQLTNVIKNYTKEPKNSENKLTISYYLYENDKADKNKKNADAKKYAGYLMFDFVYNQRLIYKIQTDYMKLDASDVNERMDCVIKSFISIKGN